MEKGTTSTAYAIVVHDGKDHALWSVELALEDAREVLGSAAMLLPESYRLSIHDCTITIEEELEFRTRTH